MVVRSRWNLRKYCERHSCLCFICQSCVFTQRFWLQPGLSVPSNIFELHSWVTHDISGLWTGSFFSVINLTIARNYFLRKVSSPWIVSTCHVCVCNRSHLRTSFHTKQLFEPKVMRMITTTLCVHLCKFQLVPLGIYSWLKTWIYWVRIVTV